jgi:hypothetical protein
MGKTLNKIVWVIWSWFLGIIWDLEFGIWNFRTAVAVLRLPCDRSAGTCR